MSCRPRSKRAACPATCYLVGGGALVTGYGGERTTRDVGARIDEAEDEVLAAAKTTAERNGLDERWLHVEAAQFVPRGENGTREDRPRTAPDSSSPALRPSTCWPMKVFAAREPDLEASWCRSR